MSSADFGQAATVFVRVGFLMMSVVMSVVVMMVVGVAVLMRVWVGHSCPSFPGSIFFSVDDHVNLGGADAATIYFRDFQRCADVQGGNRFFEDFGRDSGVDQGGEEHVAADSREAV